MPRKFQSRFPLKRYILCLWAVLISVIIFSCSGTQQKIQPGTKTALVFYYQAEENIKQGNFTTAITNLDSAIYYNPGFANLYQLKGWVWEKLSQQDSAIIAYENCLKYRSAQPEIQKRLALLYFETGQFEASASYFKKTLQAYPDTAEIHLQLGKAYHQLGFHPLALGYFQSYRELETSPKAELWKWAGLARFKTSAYAKAIVNLEKYIEVHKEDAAALKHLGIAKFKSGEYEDAISYLNFAEAYSKDDPEIYLYRSRYFLLADRPEIAKVQLDRALQIDSLNVNTLYELGVLYHQQEEYSKCSAKMSKVIALENEYWPAYRYLGFLAERENDFSKAQEYYKLYLENTIERDEEVRQRFEAVTTGVKNE